MIIQVILTKVCRKIFVAHNNFHSISSAKQKNIWNLSQILHTNISNLRHLKGTGSASAVVSAVLILITGERESVKAGQH